MSSQTINDIQRAVNEAMCSPEYAEFALKNGRYYTLRACLGAVGVRSSFLSGDNRETVGLTVRNLTTSVSNPFVVTIKGDGATVSSRVITPAGAY